MNTLIVSGNLTADIETRAVGDHQVHNFTIAINQGDRTTFLPSEAWDMPHLERFLHKGSKVLVRGCLKQNDWETDKGERRSRLVATAYEVEFLDLPKRAPEGNQGNAMRSSSPGRENRRRPRNGSGSVREISAAYEPRLAPRT